MTPVIAELLDAVQAKLLTYADSALSPTGSMELCFQLRRLALALELEREGPPHA